MGWIWAPAWLRPGLLDRYVLRLMIPAMAAAFGVMLSALLLYRVMEIVYALSATSASFELVFGLIGNLLPHYLGLAVPAAYFIAVFMTTARLGDANEIDALLGAGVSIDRLLGPFVMVGLAIGVYSIVLMGYGQPLGRYGYNLVLDKALAASWDARLQPRSFVSSGGELAMTAESTDIAGRSARGVFISRRLPDGREQVFTAKSAALSPTPDGRRLTAVLSDGRQFEDRTGRQALVGTFERFVVEFELEGALRRFRPRGATARELTLDELARRPNDASARAELYQRLVRSISAPLLPLLAMPLGMAAKRGRRGPGLAIAGLILLMYEHAIDFGQALTDFGHVAPEPAVWGPFAAFVVICAALYAGSRKRPGENPLSLIWDAGDDLVRRLRGAGRPLARRT